MAGKKTNLSDHKKFNFTPDAKTSIGIVVSEWNTEVTGALCQGAVDSLVEYGIKPKAIDIRYVPGSFELPLGAFLMLQAKKYDAIICLGCIIQGETRHFEFIAQAVAKGIMDLGLGWLTPVIFGVLTTDTIEQAKARAGGKHGNKGVEAAVSALKMIQLTKDVKGKK
jgi:6,7-dimethyl-8-ribityllumazine synthase